MTPNGAVSDLREETLAEHVIDRDGLVWRVVRDGGMATRADYNGIVSIGIAVLEREHGPLTSIAADRDAADAEAYNAQADYDRRGERLWRLAALAGWRPGNSADNDVTAEAVTDHDCRRWAVGGLADGTSGKAHLWLSITGAGSTMEVTLAKCRNCGKVKIGSSPCGFDHLAALMEFNAYLDDQSDAHGRDERLGTSGGDPT